MNIEELVTRLNENPSKETLEAVRLLIKIAQNILKDPFNTQRRTLKKSNPIIANKILPINGTKFCLTLMGFQESETSFVLPVHSSLEALHSGVNALLTWKESIEANPFSDLYATPVPLHKPKPIKPFVLPPIQALYKFQFFHQIEIQFHECLRYASKDVQERAKELVPIAKLQQFAQERLRAIQEHIKKNKLEDPNISIQDMMILELLQWFKENFFTWVNSPDCEKCGSKSHFSHMSNDKNLFVYTKRVELHRCESCGYFTAFPRYNDLNILLETRKGRCGEWANTFTLFCKAMGWDARFVLDDNDHVWTEVYSIAQKRWLHCDPCENICDKPLIYEIGWKKKMTYVIAYSDEEVQDVTWRYSCDHKQVLKRRSKCDENKLIDVLIELRKRRQSTFSEAKRAYLTKRLVVELAEFLTERKPGDGENKGRQSGDEIWRLARGETHQEEAPLKYIWQIDPENLVNNEACIRYSAANDDYHYLTGGKIKICINNWRSGCYDHKNIARKEERDWKQVYIARTENSTQGKISWKFEFKNNPYKTLHSITINFPYATYENGTVTAKIFTEDLCELITNGTFITEAFAGKTSVTIEATLSGGTGDVSWQHAQLFRQQLNSQEFPFNITFNFK